MNLHQLTRPRLRPKSRVGRGVAAGQGKTAGRGTKGQKSRTGYKAPKRIPGLMSASDYRWPKRKGFKSARPVVVTVTLKQLDHFFQAGETVSPDALVAKKLIKAYGRGGVKVIGAGKLKKKLIFKNIKLTKAVAETEAIEFPVR